MNVENLNQSVNDPGHKLWIILEKSVKIWLSHCTCMASMGETCNHVAAAVFQVEAAVRTGLTNPLSTSSTNECRKDIEPTKIKDLNFDREDFAQCGKKERSLVASPKKYSTR